jgi:hypothetical protein
MSVEKIMEDSTVRKIEDAEVDLITGERSASATGQVEDVQRFWDNETRSHIFLVPSSSKFTEVVNNPTRYQSEGNEFDSVASWEPGAMAVNRFTNRDTGTNFYTLQRAEEITAAYPVFQFEEIAFYAFPARAGDPQPFDAIPVYRLYNSSTSQQTGSPVHFYTSDFANYQTVKNGNPPGFLDEGVGFYAYPETYNGTSF